MAEVVTAEVSGLQVSNNTFSASPPGSLIVAENCVMPQKGVIEPVRGQARSCEPASASQIPFSVTEFANVVLANMRTSRTDAASTLANCSAATAVNYSGTYNPVDNWRMNFAQAATYLYFCSTTGPKCLETIASAVRAAGLLRMPDPFCYCTSATNLGANGAGMEYDTARAYKTVLRKPTSSGTSLLSPPSGRQIVTNRLVAPVGAMTRTGGNLVTVTFPYDPSRSLGISVADTFDLTPGEADFAAGSYAVASVTANVITYASVGANVSNTAIQDFDTGIRPCAVIIPLTSDATTSTPVRVYRTVDTSSSTIEPTDEFFLVDEVFPSGAQITAGYIVYLDITPSSVISDPLYTNPLTGEGPTQVNNQPPIYRDVATWGERTWFANTTALQQLALQVIGVGSPTGIQNNDTLTVNDGSTDYVFTFKTTPAVPGDVQIVSLGVPGYNIATTAQNLIFEFTEVFKAAGVAISGYYSSSENEAPGKILLQATSYSQGAFTVKASRPGSWTPALSASVATSSVAERALNSVAYSKLGQPESVPPLNFTACGSKSFPIRRIIGLQNALLVFKAGDGVYSITGSFPYQVLQISTANILAPDACAQFADAAWVYTDQGILRISDSGGATVVSRPIETLLNQQYIELQNETTNYAFAVPYETERRVLFFMPVELSDVSPHRPVMRAWCYCNATQAWTGPLYVDAFSGCVATSVNKLMLGVYDYAWSTGRVTIERKQGDYRDIAGADFGSTVSAVDGTVLTLSSITDVEVGDGILRSTGWRSKIAALRPDVGVTCVEVYEEGCTTGSVSIYKHYDVNVQFQPAGSPTSRKTLTRLAWVFKPEQFANYAGISTLLTDQIQANEEIDTPGDGFGLTGFGTGLFGNPTPLVVDVNPLASSHTNAAQFFPGFSLSEAWCKFKLQGFTAGLATQTAPTGRGR